MTRRRSFFRWMDDMWFEYGTLFVVVVAIIIFIGIYTYFSNKEAAARKVACATLMHYATDRHDTLQVLIACQQAEDAAELRRSVGVAAGVVAGSAAAAAARR